MGLPRMDPEIRPDHRLAAIMATDVVGYSRLMQSNEVDALAALATIREATQNQIKQHRRRIAKSRLEHTRFHPKLAMSR